MVKHFSVTLVDEKVPIEAPDYNNFEYEQHHPDEPSCKPPLSDKQMSWIDGIFGCMKPVLSLIGKGSLSDVRMRNEDDWIIPFEVLPTDNLQLLNFNYLFFHQLISDIEWLGSGAQGAVFSGKLYNDIVAVKKVKDVRETDIKHLRKLNHENIVKFK